jgi:zinc transporter ZupT
MPFFICAPMMQLTRVIMLYFYFFRVGIMLSLVCEQIALHIISTTRNDRTLAPKSHQHVEEKQDGDEEENLPNSHKHSHYHHTTGAAATLASPSPSPFPSPRLESSEVASVVAVFANAHDSRALLKAYVLEAAIAVHSIIMGISLGSMQSDELSHIKILLVAYAIHQLMEGISLG